MSLFWRNCVMTLAPDRKKCSCLVSLRYCLVLHRFTRVMQEVFCLVWLKNTQKIFWTYHICLEHLFILANTRKEVPSDNNLLVLYLSRRCLLWWLRFCHLYTAEAQTQLVFVISFQRAVDHSVAVWFCALLSDVQCAWTLFGCILLS